MNDQNQQSAVESLLHDHPFIWGYSLLDHGIWETDQLNANDKLVYLAITSKTNSNSAVAWPSMNTIAKMTSLSKPTVIKSVAKLEKVDLLVITKIAYQSNKYRIKPVQKSDKLGLDQNDVLEQLEKTLKMPIEQAISTLGHDGPPGDDVPTADPVPYKKIMDHLNDQAGTKYSHTGQANQKLMKARYNELKKSGLDADQIIQEFIHVIDVKTAQWKDGDMAQYLRPVTLFGNKFDQYRNEAPQQKAFAPSTNQTGSQSSEDRFKNFLESDD